MLVCISGTPGCGKTTVSRILSKITGFRLIEVNEFAREKGLFRGVDRKRKSKIVDVLGLRKASKGLGGNIILAGHLSHFAKCGICIVLRTNPEELEKRLKKKGWNDEKISENVEAEILDVCLKEAVDEQGMAKVFEIDTTGKSPEETANIIKGIIEGKNCKKYQPGKIDWTKYLDLRRK